MSKPKESEEIIVPKKVSVIVDKRTRARNVAFPFTFPDGTNGALIVCRLSAMPWEPSDTLESIIITYAKHEEAAD